MSVHSSCRVGEARRHGISSKRSWECLSVKARSVVGCQIICAVCDSIQPGFLQVHRLCSSRKRQCLREIRHGQRSQLAWAHAVHAQQLPTEPAAATQEVPQSRLQGFLRWAAANGELQCRGQLQEEDRIAGVVATKGQLGLSRLLPAISLAWSIAAVPYKHRSTGVDLIVH